MIGYLAAAAIQKQIWPPQPSVRIATEANCSLSGLPELTDVRLTSASIESSHAPHCKIAGVIETEIRFELLLPNDWSGKFVMGGGSGFAGEVVNVATYFGALQSGYATVGTDTGHSAHPRDASWALDHPERVENFGHRAVHLTATTAKALVEGYYDQPSSNNYFVGCSLGGGQALMEAQRYPEDFDGIVAGAPAYNWTMGIGANATQINQVMYPDPDNLEEAIIGPEDQALIATHYLEQCDALDGIEDGILTDPRACPFEVDSLRCEDGKSSACLTTEQVHALTFIYQGPYDDQGPLFPGYPLGGEISDAGMSEWLTGGLKYTVAETSDTPGNTDKHETPVIPNGSFGFGNGIMKYLVFNDPHWDYSSYSFKNYRQDSMQAAQILNATSPDLSAFRNRGGKLLMYHGWSDMALSALGTIAYFDALMSVDASASDDVRLYLMPGVDHCFGGDGPWLVNFLSEIDSWVVSGKQPEELTAKWLKWMLIPYGSRLICPYPQQLRYDGVGDTRDADGFSCANDASW